MATDFAAVARLLGNDARSAMLDALLDGRSLSAGELARVAGIGRSSASAHLGLLVDGRLAVVRRAGRHRYYRLAGVEVAEALEALALICPPRPVRSLRQSAEATRLAGARTCYDHLAGGLGVVLLDGLLAQRWLRSVDAGWTVTGRGEAGLTAMQVDVDAARSAKRTFARPCLDWTERRPHLAGSLGAAIASRALAARWVQRPDEGRGLVLTPTGRRELSCHLNLKPELLTR